MALEKELETYRRKLQELLADEGKFVLIQGDEVAGVAAAILPSRRAAKLNILQAIVTE